MGRADSTDRYITKGEAAFLLQRSRWSIDKYIRADHLRTIRLRGKVLVSQNDVLKILDELPVGTTTNKGGRPAKPDGQRPWWTSAPLTWAYATEDEPERLVIHAFAKPHQNTRRRDTLVASLWVLNTSWQLDPPVAIQTEHDMDCLLRATSVMRGWLPDLNRAQRLVEIDWIIREFEHRMRTSAAYTQQRIPHVAAATFRAAALFRTPD